MEWEFRIVGIAAFRYRKRLNGKVDDKPLHPGFARVERGRCGFRALVDAATVVDDRTSFPLPAAEISEAGDALRRALDSEGIGALRTFWLDTLQISVEVLQDVARLTPQQLTALNLPESDPALYRKLKALVALTM